jgi:hypothetical protein
MEVSKYNGWTNYETWALALWLSNEESMANWIGKSLGKFDEDYDGAEWLKAYCQEHFDLIFEQIKEGTFWKDIMNDLFCASLSEVNWFEIAVNMKEERDEDEGDEDD